MNNNRIVRPMIDRAPDPWQMEIVSAFTRCTRRFMQLGRAANQHEIINASHGMQAVEALKFAAFLSLLLEALDELLTTVVESGNTRLKVLPHGHHAALLQEELWGTVNAFLDRAAADGMSGYDFMLRKYRDDIQARFPL
jgi:hypothetical protein